MKPTEQKQFWKLLKDGEERPLSAVELRFFMRVRSALMDYEDEVKLGHHASERRCMICGVSGVRIAGMMNAKPVTPVRARFVLVVSDLKPDPRAGGVAQGWLAMMNQNNSV